MTGHGTTGLLVVLCLFTNQEDTLSWFRKWRRRWLESIAASRNSVAYELLVPIDED